MNKIFQVFEFECKVQKKRVNNSDENVLRMWELYRQFIMLDRNLPSTLPTIYSVKQLYSEAVSHYSASTFMKVVTFLPNNELKLKLIQPLWISCGHALGYKCRSKGPFVFAIKLSSTLFFLLYVRVVKTLPVTEFLQTSSFICLSWLKIRHCENIKKDENL